MNALYLISYSAVLMFLVRHYYYGKYPKKLKDRMKNLTVIYTIVYIVSFFTFQINTFSIIVYIPTLATVLCFYLYNRK